MLPRRSFITFGFSFFAAGCTGSSKLNKARMTPPAAIGLVNQLPDSLAKQVSLAVINSPQTKSRIDQNGLPAWTWRDGVGNDGYGGCVHIHPETGEPYLETQFPKNKRPLSPVSPKGRKPEKYILFNHAGQWHGRVHHLFPVEWEENWQAPKAHDDGEVLLRDLAALFDVDGLS